MKVVSIVGMSGSGKSEVARLFGDKGFTTVRFGDVTDEEVKKQGLELNEENERQVRESLREKYGMAAYALLNLPRIDAALKSSDVVVDGLYSWEEYNYLKTYYGEDLIIVAVWASPKTRYARLSSRQTRPLTARETSERDHAEIQNLNKGEPIAMADFTIINECPLTELKKQVDGIMSQL